MWVECRGREVKIDGQEREREQAWASSHKACGSVVTYYWVCIHLFGSCIHLLCRSVFTYLVAEATKSWFYLHFKMIIMSLSLISLLKTIWKISLNITYLMLWFVRCSHLKQIEVIIFCWLSVWEEKCTGANWHLSMQLWMTWLRKQLGAHHACDVYDDNYPVIMRR